MPTDLLAASIRQQTGKKAPQSKPCGVFQNDALNHPGATFVKVLTRTFVKFDAADKSTVSTTHLHYIKIKVANKLILVNVLK